MGGQEEDLGVEVVAEMTRLQGGVPRGRRRGFEVGIVDEGARYCRRWGGTRISCLDSSGVVGGGDSTISGYVLCLEISPTLRRTL